jgi:hypothetical protein
MKTEYIYLIIVIFVIYRFIIRPIRQDLNSGTTKKVVQKESDTLTPQEKGKKFEDFVVKRFQSEKFYKLKEWRGDKYLAGHFYYNLLDESLN